MISCSNIDLYLKDCVWIQNVGQIPSVVNNEEHLIVRYHDGSIGYGMSPWNYDWNLNRPYSIKDYAIVDELNNEI